MAELVAAVLGKAVSLAADELCLSFGVKKELLRLAKKLEMIQALLSDARTKQLTSLIVQNWLKQLASVALDAQIVLDDFGYQVLREKIECRKRDKVRGFFSSSNPVYLRVEMAHKVKDVLSSLEEIWDESRSIGLLPAALISSPPDLMAKRFTDPYVQDSEIVGRDEDVSKVLSMLTGSDYEKGLPIITILGMGGQGKTTLAQLVYKNDEVGNYFKKKVWVCVSHDFNVEKILALILESLTETTCLLSSREVLVNKLKKQLDKEKYLLVLDDVWNENRDEWDVLRRCLLEIGGTEGSKVMVTTRSEEVAFAMRTSGYHRLQLLSEEESLDLFVKCAFASGGAKKTPELISITKRILKRCGGVPLAIKAIGCLLYSKTSEPEWSIIERSELWNVSNTRGGGVLSAIRLSYDHLPSPFLKQCFAYCATFPKDSIFQEDVLVQLWMAQGFLNPPEGSQLQMEDMGNMYLNILLKSSLLQDVPKNPNHDDIMQCKMHDLVHDFSLEISESCLINRDCITGRKESETLHLSVTNVHEKGLWTSLKDTVSSKLRTLKVGYGFSDVLEDWFVKFRCLTVLTIEVHSVSELPNAIGKVTHLRFLDIHRTKIHKLPKSFTELYYFQTLRINCLDELPEGCESLINLRHLYVTQLNPKPGCLMTGIGQLTNLQTLPYFMVDESKGCRIEELEHLDNLRGELKIFCLQNVSSYESSLRANLSKKSNIRALELHWDRRGREYDCNDAEVMESLKPHLHLKSLEIDGYQGQNFPSWMIAKNGVMLHRHMVKIVLKSLDLCQHLPSLGDLPYLEHLEIRQLKNLKCIGKEFYGRSNLEAVKKSNSSADRIEITLFPALRVLNLCFMYNLEEWSDAHPTAKLFPFLEELEMNGLPNLNVFPDLGSLPCLQHLHMTDCDNLTLPSSWNTSLEEGVSSVFDNNPIGYFPSLTKLSIRSCNKLAAPLCSLKTMAQLKSLCILGNPGLWPKDLHHLSNLESLELAGRPREIHCFPWPYSMSCSPHSLTSLKLHGWPLVTSLCDEIQYATSLKILEICNFSGIKALPEWLGKLDCLQHLNISICKNLKQFPSAYAFQRLSSMQSLTVSGCPLLEERCTKGSGTEWSKISHIPYITFGKWFHRAGMRGEGKN